MAYPNFPAGANALTELLRALSTQQDPNTNNRAPFHPWAAASSGFPQPMQTDHIGTDNAPNENTTNDAPDPPIEPPCPHCHRGGEAPPPSPPAHPHPVPHPPHPPHHHHHGHPGHHHGGRGGHGRGRGGPRGGFPNAGGNMFGNPPNNTSGSGPTPGFPFGNNAWGYGRRGGWGNGMRGGAGGWGGMRGANPWSAPGSGWGQQAQANPLNAIAGFLGVDPSTFEPRNLRFVIQQAVAAATSAAREAAQQGAASANAAAGAAREAARGEQGLGLTEREQEEEDERMARAMFGDELVNLVNAEEGTTDATVAAAATGSTEKDASTKEDDVDFIPALDIYNLASSYVVHVNLPGARKEDVNLSFDEKNQELTVSGLLSRHVGTYGEDEEEDREMVEALALIERPAGVFCRKVKLGGEAGGDKVEPGVLSARMESGILVITVGKKIVEEGFESVPPYEEVEGQSEKGKGKRVEVEEEMEE